MENFRENNNENENNDADNIEYWIYYRLFQLAPFEFLDQTFWRGWLLCAVSDWINVKSPTTSPALALYLDARH